MTHPGDAILLSPSAFSTAFCSARLFCLEASPVSYIEGMSLLASAITLRLL
jgi:hypothetical protein